MSTRKLPGLNGVKFSGNSSAYGRVASRIQVDEEPCVAGSIVVEKRMPCNGIRL